MTEQWLPVVGWEELYEVSDQGRVRSLDRIVLARNGKTRPHYGKVLTPGRRNRLGHLIVNMSVENRPQVRQVHDLVLRAFVGPPHPGEECRHLNGISGDNRLENLCWGTSQENSQDTVQHGMHHYARRTHCNKGHAFTLENTQCRSDSGRRCRECNREKNRRQYHARKAAA